jgi:hypothetical protein
MVFNLNNIANSVANNVANAIKPYNPIKIDASTIGTSIRSAIDTEFSNIQNNLTSTLKDLASNKFNDLITTGTTGLGGLSFSSSGMAAGFNKTMNWSSTGLASLLNVNTNPLNEYANYTYHIRFFMTNDVQAYNGINNASPNSNGLTKIIIAESGITAGFNIISLTAEAAGNANANKRNMWSNTNYTLVINEPLGITLLDKLYYSARELKVVNHIKCPYFIEIWFTGYNEDGTIAANNLFYSLNRVKIIEIAADSSHVGTTYTLNIINDSVWAEFNAISTPPSTMTIEASTLGEFFTKFEQKWNYMESNINQDGLTRNNYTFKIPNDWKSWTLRNPDVLKQNSRNAPMYAELQGGLTTVTINRGQSVETVVDFVVYLCQEAQKWITGENSPASGAASLYEQGMIRYVTVYPKVELDQTRLVDPVTQDYVQNITYMLIPTESVKSYTDMETVKAVQNITTRQSKLNYLLSNNRLARKYEYIYTGKNTEVLKFDFNLQNLWTISQPTWIQSNSYDQYTQGPVIDINSVGVQQVKGLLNRTKLLPTGVLNILDSASNVLDNLANPIADAITTIKSAVAEEKQLLTNQINNQVAGLVNTLNTNTPSTSADKSNVAFNNTLVLNLNAGDITKSIIAKTEAELFANTQSTVKLLSERQRALSDRFAEDATPTTAKSMLPVTGMFDSKPSQQQVRQNADQNKLTSLSDPNAYVPGTGWVGAIIGNLYQNAAFLNIDLSIRGDPWWIPIGNIFQNTLAEELVGTQRSTGNGSQVYNASYLGGDNEILLEFRAGVIINEDTGLAIVDQNGADFFTGLYVVNNITNTFNRGKFTQLLKCARDVLTDTAPGSSPNTSRDRQDVTTPKPAAPTTSRDRQDVTTPAPIAPTPNVENRR